MARTLLRAETWHGEAGAAAHAVDDLLDAAAAVDLAPHHDPWVLDALVQAGRRHGIADAATDALRRAHAALADHPGLPDAHRARVRATHAPSAAAWTDAAAALAAAHAGPEWVVDALRDAAALDPSHADRLRDTAARYGVGLR
jgi:hypothetical protein